MCRQFIVIFWFDWRNFPIFETKLQCRFLTLDTMFFHCLREPVNALAANGMVNLPLHNFQKIIVRIWKVS